MEHMEQTAYFEELETLSTLQAQYQNSRTPLPINQEDPDVKQLIEAMASFMAKARIAGKKQVDQLHLRTFEQLLPYVACAIPSMALVKANTRALVEPVMLPRGTRFSIETADGDSAQYQTLASHQLAPLSLAKLGFSQPEAQGACRMLLVLHCPTGQAGDLARLPVYINVHNQFSQSVALAYFLKNHLVNVDAVFDDTFTLSVPHHLGPHSEDSRAHLVNETRAKTANTVVTDHPIFKERQFFQLPESENFLHLDLTGAPSSWRTCQLSLTLNTAPPNYLSFSLAAFQLNVIPCINLCQGQADPLAYNGTQSQLPINAPTANSDFSLLQTLGVYSVQGKQQKALRHGIIKGGAGSYEIHRRQVESPAARCQHWLAVNLPEAFDQPCKLVIDGLWHQPLFSAALWKQLRVFPSTIDLKGVSWGLVKAPVPQRENVDLNARQLLDLSLLKNKSRLTVSDLIFLCDSLGSVWASNFDAVKTHLKEIDTEYCRLPDPHGAESYALRYIVTFDKVSADYIPLLDRFLEHLQVLLNAWLPEQRILVSTAGVIEDISTPATARTPRQHQLSNLSSLDVEGDSYVL
jgi:type VI secretion system protein ImpG